MTREVWQQRVEEARRRSQEFVAGARTLTADPPPIRRTWRQLNGRCAIQRFVKETSSQPEMLSSFSSAATNSINPAISFQRRRDIRLSRCEVSRMFRLNVSRKRS
jgi:hypothetical protein